MNAIALGTVGGSALGNPRDRATPTLGLGQVPYETAERIRFRKAQYCRFVDTKQWAEFEKVLLPNATFTFFGVDGELVHTIGSPKALIEQTASFVEGAHTSHRVSNSELSAVSDTQVSAVWAMEDYLVFPPKDGKPSTSMHGYGHYHEDWRLVDGEWAIARLELRRTILELT